MDFKKETEALTMADSRRRSIELLAKADWGQDAARIEGLKAWSLYPLVLQAMEQLQVESLYISPVHGSGHINRVLLMAALIAWQEDLPTSLLQQYLAACSYHDVGRTFDGLDLEHGARSAERLEELTPYRGEALLELQAAVTAHSQPDSLMEEILAQFAPADLAHTRQLACLLKDADNLDRVRLGDLKPEFLRHDSAKDLVGFSVRLLALDQALKEQLR